MQSDDLVVVYTNFDEIEVMFCKEVLEAAGIPVVELKRSDSYWTDSFVLEPSRLSVRSSDATRAQAIVADYQRRVDAGEYALHDEEEP